MKNNQVLNFCAVKCVKSGRGFIKGQYYAQIGTNNGVSVFRENEQGDRVSVLCHHGLARIGDLGPDDDSCDVEFQTYYHCYVLPDWFELT